jgi:putative transcriptional regulator
MSAATVNSDQQYNESCLRDHFLLAMPGLDSGIFAHSITYLCEHGPSGAMGIIVNRTLDLNLAEIFSHLEIEAIRDFSAVQIMAGGPVQTDHGFVLHAPCGRTWDATLQITDELLLTTSQDILRAIALGEGPREYLIALGYAGWSPGQLEDEIAMNSWLTVPADSEILFHTPPEQRLQAAAAHLGIDMNLLSAEAGHA